MKQIKELLENFNIKSPSGKDKWDCKTINNLLSNEKIYWKCISTKTFVSDALTGKKEANIDKSKVYIKNNHDFQKNILKRFKKFKKMRSRCIFDEKETK